MPYEVQLPPIEAMLDSIDVELSGYCNANCVFCPRQRMTREKAILTPELFGTLLNEVAEVHPDGPSVIFFCGLGEPLINKNVVRFAEMVTELFPDTLIYLVSNGGLLDRELCDAILHSPILSFSCSMNSLEEKEYGHLMPGVDFHSVMHWMRYLAEKKIETGLRVAVTCVRTTQSDVAMLEYHHFWQSLGVASGENPLHSRGGFLYRNAAESRPAPARCQLFENRLFVAGNGDVLACCQDLDGQSRLGTLGREPLQEILERKRARIAASRLFAMCGSCDDPVKGSGS